MREYGYLFLLVAHSEQHARSVLSGCQAALDVKDTALIAHRYSTRPEPLAYEVPLSEAEFQARQDLGCFVLDWRAADYQFAAGVEVDRWLDGGLNVLLYANSKMIEQAKQRYRHHLRVVYAPGKDSRTWLERVIGEKVRFRQLGLAFEENRALAGPVDGLKLSDDPETAVEQLTAWMRQEEPPALAA